MKNLIITALLLVGMGTANAADLSLKTRFQFSSVKEGKKLVGKSDVYSQGLSKFDYASKLKDKKATEQDYLDNAASEVVEWTDKEKEKLQEIIADLEVELDAAIGIKFNLPKHIPLVKSTGKEEGGADAYTRRHYIVLSSGALKGSKQKLKELLLHELFHVISRFNPELRQKLYHVIGFKVVNQVDLPKLTQRMLISNPDAPVLDSYINIKDNRGKSYTAGMILYSDEAYEKGSFFDYLKIGFVELEEKDGKWVAVRDPENEHKAIVHEFRNFAKGLFDKVGGNTDYIIDPEEIMAENFQKAVLNTGGRSPEILKQVKDILKGSTVEF